MPARRALHAYVLMTNHVHLLLTPKNAERVSHLIIALGRRYVQYINRTYQRTGTLWDSRYKSYLMHAGGHVFVTRYLMFRRDRVDWTSRKCEPGPNGTYLTVLGVRRRKFVRQRAPINIVAPAQAGG